MAFRTLRMVYIMYKLGADIFRLFKQMHHRTETLATLVIERKKRVAKLVTPIHAVF